MAKTPNILSVIFFNSHGMDVETMRHNLTTRTELQGAVDQLRAGEDSSTELEVTIHGYEDVIQDWLDNNPDQPNVKGITLSSEHSIFSIGTLDDAEIIENRIYDYKHNGQLLDEC
ncbi:MAG: hypothetical protein JXR12_06675 [Neptunomonas phycophila]|uniref:hypothetical protein n=1 Tax=Neptunomonas phycophila TaxID=1572645 RepID=UPI003B8BF110